MSNPHLSYRVGTAMTEEVLPLRMSVLRDGTPSQDPRYAEDDDDSTVHLVMRDDSGVIVATSTWLPRPFPVEPDAPGVQLRGMAVDKTLQSRGVGAILLAAGIERARQYRCTQRVGPSPRHRTRLLRTQRNARRRRRISRRCDRHVAPLGRHERAVNGVVKSVSRPSASIRMTSSFHSPA